MTEDGWLAMSVWLSISLCAIAGFTYGYCKQINREPSSEQYALLQAPASTVSSHRVSFY